jgi:hypothetical protein
MTMTETTMLSFAPEVIADSSGKWAGNGLRFATEAEATLWVRDLERRWMLVTATRVVPSPDPVSHRIERDADGRLVMSTL